MEEPLSVFAAGHGRHCCSPQKRGGELKAALYCSSPINVFLQATAGQWAPPRGPGRTLRKGRSF